MTRRPEAGFTLIELMISILITSLAIGAALAMGTTMMRSYSDHRRMIMVERSARVSLEIMADALRNAAPGVGSGNVDVILTDGADCLDPGAVVVTNGDPAGLGRQAPDRLRVVYGSGGVITSLRAAFDSGDDELTVLDGSSFATGDFALVTDLSGGVLVRLDSADDTTLGTEAPASVCPGVTFPTGGYPAGSLVIRAKIASFFVLDDDSVGNVPTLMMDPDAEGDGATAEPLADGIEDLQVAVGVDVNGDGTVVDTASDGDEWFYNFDSDADDDAFPALTVTPPRAVRVSVVARSVQPDDGDALYLRPAVEDHVAAEDNDNYRRRQLSTTVEFRNIEGSP